MTYKDWRPEKLDVESIATDAQLTRIEAKIDALLAAQVSNRPSVVEPYLQEYRAADVCRGHPCSGIISASGGSGYQPNMGSTCNICGKPVSQHG